MKQKLLIFSALIWCTFFSFGQTPATHLNFDGIDDSINLPQGAITNGTQGTIEVWVYPTAADLDNQTILAIPGTGFFNYNTILSIGGIAADNGKVFYQSNTNNSLVSNSTLVTGNWYHIAVVFYETGAKMYINGVLDVIASGNFSLPVETSSANPIIGNLPNPFGGQYFKGNIEEFRFWNYARTAEQIKGSKNCELIGSETGLVTYYKFNQGLDLADNTTLNIVLASTGSDGILNSFALTGSISNWLYGSPVTSGSIVPAAPVASNQTYCGETLASALIPAISTTIKWYNSSESSVQATDFLVSGTYYVVAENGNGCESEKTYVTIINETVAPTATTTIYNYTVNQTPTSLEGTVTGTNLMWYTSQYGGTGVGTAPAISTASLGTSSYWVAQNNNGCESDRLEIKVIVNPINDICSGAISLAIGTTFEENDVTVDVSTATPTGLGLDTCIYGNDVWYSFVMPASGKLKIEARGLSTNFAGYVALFSGTCEGLTQLKCSTNIDADDPTKITIAFSPSISLSPEPNSTVYLLTSASINTETNVLDTYQISAYDDSPINDDCTGAISLTVGTEFSENDVTVDVSGASYSNSDVNCNTSSSDVWYSFVVPTTGTVIVKAAGFSNDYEGGFVVYDGDCSNLGAINCNNSNDNNENSAAVLKLTGLTPNTTMYIKTWAWENYDTGGFSPYQISVYDNAPVNDNCSGAIALTAGADSDDNLVDVDTSNAYPANEFSYENDVWYSVLVPASGSITIQTSGSSPFDTILKVYNDCNESTELGYNNDIDAENGNIFSKVELTGLTAASTIYVKVFENIQVDDKMQNPGTGQFQISAYDTSLLNSAPTDISLSADTIDENVVANSTIATLSSTDPDVSNTFTYALVPGFGDTDNASFNISGNSLKITNSPDFETKNTYVINIRTTDQGGLFFEQAFVLVINNLNEAPTALSLSAIAINENVAANSTIGTLSSTDPDDSNTFAYTLVSGTGSTDNASFNISGNSLVITNSPDFETQNSYSVRVRTTDQGGLFYEETFTININNIVETPATHLNFDGVNDVVNLGSALTTYFTGKTQVTMQAWVRPETNSGLGVIVGNYNYPTNVGVMQMMLRRDNGNYAFYLDSGSGFTAISATGSVVVNTWQHITCTWDGSTMKIYVNGVLANSSAKTGTIPAKPTSFSIGSNVAERFGGAIDEVRLWDKALSATDIMNTMNCEVQSQPELIAYYKFNQGIDGVSNTSITTLTDSAGSNNGTLANFALTGTTSNWLAGSVVTSGNTCTVLETDSFSKVNNVNVYPNPSTGIFNISIQEDANITVNDILGKVIYSNIVKAGNNTIDISNYQSGIYLLNISNENGSVNKKLIKE